MLRKAASAASDFASETTDKAKTAISDAADIASNTVDAAKIFGSSATDSISNTTRKLRDNHWPTIEKVVTEGLLTIAADRLRDEAAVKGVMENAYELLPVAIRLVVPRDSYLKFVFQHRETLLTKLSDYQSEKPQTTEQPTMLMIESNNENSNADVK